MVDVAGADVVAILTRAPSAGGKSRLFAALGRAPDPGLLEALLLDTLDGAGRPGVVRVVAVAPASACDEIRALAPADVGVLPQPAGSLGDRMRGVMEALLARGARAVVLMGSDLPDIAPRLIDAAFAALDRDPQALVIGPAADGGYYLLGATRTPDVFDGIAWGGPDVLATTLNAAAGAGLRVHLLDPWRDVDTVEELIRLVSSPVPPGAPPAGPAGASAAGRTRRWARAVGLPGFRAAARPGQAS